jgi:hypothetical protein
MNTYIFTLKAGEVFEIDAENIESAWSTFYDKLRPLTQEQTHTLLHSVKLRQ